MTIEELKNYIGCYVSFSYAIPKPFDFPEKEHCSESVSEGILAPNNGSLSYFTLYHFGIIDYDHSEAIRNDFIPYIVDFKVLKNNKKEIN